MKENDGKGGTFPIDFIPLNRGVRYVMHYHHYGFLFSKQARFMYSF